MRRGVRGGVFGALEGCFAGDFGAATRHEWDADGAFCRGIPGFSAQARVRRDGSAHGRHRRALGAKKFLKIFKKGVKNRKIGVREVPEGGMRAPYIGRTGWFLGLEARPLAVLLGVRFVQASQVRAPTVRHRSETSEIRSPYIERVCLQAPSLTLWRYLCLSDAQFPNLHLWLESTRLPYAGYDHILSK